MVIRNPFFSKNHILKINNKKYIIPISDYHTFLNLDEDAYNKCICLKKYKNIPIEYFIYSLVTYFNDKQKDFNERMLNRYLELKNGNIIDYESINKILKTNDKKLPKVKINSEINSIISTKYDDNILKNIIKVYLELCRIFTYDDLYYIDDLRDGMREKLSINYLSNINKKNNKVVCFQFTEIFGYFLNSINIPYEVVGSQTFYGYTHTYIKFKFDKFIITINPIHSIYNCDYTNVKVGNNLTGIECINENIKTRLEFQNILRECYQKQDLTLSDYLPYNKIENDIIIPGVLKDYVQKIDLIFKKINELNLDVIDKLSYFNTLMHVLFNDSINKNICYSFVTDYFNIAYIIAINEINIRNSNNIYLMYYKNCLRFINKEELEELFEIKKFKYLDKRHLPNIKDK